MFYIVCDSNLYYFFSWGFYNNYVYIFIICDDYFINFGKFLVNYFFIIIVDIILILFIIRILDSIYRVIYLYFISICYILVICICLGICLKLDFNFNIIIIMCKY